MLSCLYLYKVVFNNLINMDIYIHIDCSSADTTRDIGRFELHSGRPHFVTKDVKIQSRGIFCGWMHYSHCNYI